MKTIIFSVFFGILFFAIPSCKKDEEKTTDPNKICNENSFSGSWEFTINKDKANEYKDTIILSWNGSTYIIDGLIGVRSDNAAYYRYQTTEKAVDIWKQDCLLKYKDSFYGRKL